MSTSITTFIDNLKELEILASKYIATKPRPENYNTKRTVLNFIRREVYNGGKWALATGSTLDSAFNSYVESEDRSLARFFGGSNSEGNNLKDDRGQKINGIHLCATLQAILFGALPSEWFGWGGDLATGARNIHDQRQAAGMYIPVDEMAEAIIGNENFNCSFTDIVSDIDAILIGDLDSVTKNLSYTFEKYYDRYYRNRFEDFVDFYGGKRKFEEKVTDVLDSRILRKGLAGDATDGEIEAACDRFVEIVYENM